MLHAHIVAREPATTLVDNAAVKQARPPLAQPPKGRAGGKSGLHRAA
jgi:hypothetical protein